MLTRAINPVQLNIVREILDGDNSNSATDVSVYSGVRAGYDLTHNADDSWTVADIDATDGDDGIDRVLNIEILRFTDQDLLIVNQHPTGALTITGSENVLTADTSTIVDANGLSTFAFTWQFSTNNGTTWSNVPGAVNQASPNLTVGNAQIGQLLRVSVTYTDQSGFPEALTSIVTAKVGSNVNVVETITGTTGANLLNGRNGNDVLNGGDGNDVLNGGAGNDTLNGDAGDDTLNGGAGNDTLNSGTGNDTLVVDIDANASGADTLNGGADTDTLSIIDTGAGNETLTAVFGTRLTQIEGGGSIAADIELIRADLGAGAGDELAYSATSSAVTVNLGAGTASGFTAIANIENVTGTNAADSLTGSNVANVLSGGGGADVLVGLAGNDTLDGGAGADTMRGGADNDTYVVDNALDVVDETAAGSSGTDTVQTTLTALTLAAGVENLTYTGNAAFGGTGNALANVINGNGGADTLNGLDGGDSLNGNGGADTLNGGLGNDSIVGGAGNDTINAGGDDDTIIWNAAFLTNDGRDIVDGGTEGAAGDTFIINGNIFAEVFRVFAKADAVAAGIYAAAGTAEIIVTRNTNGVGGAVTAANVIAELTDIEEIRINTGLGNDTVIPIGNFNPTSLNFNTITIAGSAGDDTVDISSLGSAHRIVFTSGGGHDTIIGALRPQDVVQLAPGSTLASYTSTTANGMTTLSNGTHSVTFSSSGSPTFQVPPATGNGSGGGNGGNGQDNLGGDGAFSLTAADLAALKNLVNGLQGGEDNDASGVRDLEGTGNNRAHPEYGSADQPFIRITDAHYGEYDPATGNRAINPIFDGLDARNISNILGTQEADLPKNTEGANILFMAFAQYVDHGLDFLGKGGNGVVEIGGPGTGHAPGTNNPADLTRGTVDSIDANGIPQHLNKASPYVDQNQAYGSNELVSQFLREGDGHSGFSGRLLAGGPDPSNPAYNLLPNLRELIQHHWDNNTVFTDASLPGGSVAFRDYFAGLVDSNGAIDQTMVGPLSSNFMGSGFALLLDSNPFISLLDHYVAGDGRANENFALTSIHTIWARNHNYHVEGLQEAGFQGTAEELFQAAKLINETEYQRVVFTEFVDKLIGGIKGDGEHGFDGYNPAVNASISHEFATAAYRFGHSLIGQTLTVLDANGVAHNVPLFDAFLNPTSDPSAFPVDPSQYYTPQPGYEQLGVNAILGGVATQAAEEVDFNIVDAVRNDLVRINADLFAFNVTRGWDVGIGTMNQVRADLKASQDPYVHEAVGFAGDLTPYTSWEDFQARNDLSDAVIAQFKQAYPDLVLNSQAEIDAFVAANPDIDLVDGNSVKGIDRVDLWVGGLAEKHVNGGMVGQTFWVVLHEQFDRLQEGDRFYYLERVENLDFYQIVEEQGFAAIVARNTGLTGLQENIFGVGADDEDDGVDDGTGAGNGDGDTDDDDDDTGSGNGDDGDDDQDDGTGNGDGDDDDTGSGDGDEDDDDDDTGTGSGDDDDDDGCGCGDDDDDEGTGTPAPSPSGGGSTGVGTAISDTLLGTVGGDNLIGLGGDDVLIGEAGDDAISSGEGADFVDGGAGRDTIQGGAGDDTLFAGGDADLIHGDAGADRIFGEGGNDVIYAGAGDDTVVGGAGDDLFLGETGDGNDVYFGDEIDGGNGSDTLNLSTITANLTVDLGNGLLGRGSAVSSQSGTDTLWSIENVATGAGNDTITASRAVNVMEGGAGNDTFRFLDVASADGDTILDFEPGDRLDLSGIDANTTTAGNQAFTLISGPAFTASGQLMVSYETREGVDYTIVSGNVGGGPEAEFRIDLKGSHTLTGSNFVL